MFTIQEFPVLVQIFSMISNQIIQYYQIFSMISNQIIQYYQIIQGVPKNMGIQWRIVYRFCYELAV